MTTNLKQLDMVRYKVAESLGYHHLAKWEGLRVTAALLKTQDPIFRCWRRSPLANGRIRHDIPLILKTIQESDDWYVQYDAYKALRAGWDGSNRLVHVSSKRLN